MGYFTHVGHADVIYEDADVKVLQLTLNLLEKMLSLTFRKISNDYLSFNTGI